MQTSKQYQELKAAAAKIGKKTLLPISRDLAKEIVERGKEHRRPIRTNEVQEWVVMFQGGLFEEAKTHIIIDGDDDELIDGQHILSGYVTSDVKDDLKFNVSFAHDPFLDKPDIKL